MTDRAPPLSERQLEIARLVAEGLNTKQIMARLSVSESYVHKYIVAVAHLVNPGDHSKDDRVVIARWWWETKLGEFEALDARLAKVEATVRDFTQDAAFTRAR